MVLKHAALRAHHIPPNAPVHGSLAPARARLNQWLGPVDHESYHSLKFWGLLLQETVRQRTGIVPSTVQEATRRATRLHQHWQVALRYRYAMIPRTDAQEFFREVGWFNAKAEELWK